jgi:hypothetical protein
MKPSLPFAGFLALIACVPVTGVQNPVDPLPPENACGAGDLQSLVGQDREILQTRRFRGPLRVIEAGTAVTMDFSPERLNIWLSEAGTIERVTCG